MSTETEKKPQDPTNRPRCVIVLMVYNKQIMSGLYSPKHIIFIVVSCCCCLYFCGCAFLILYINAVCVNLEWIINIIVLSSFENGEYYTVILIIIYLLPNNKKNKKNK